VERRFGKTNADTSISGTALREFRGKDCIVNHRSTAAYRQDVLK
jgi:hypothetical protein